MSRDRQVLGKVLDFSNIQQSNTAAGSTVGNPTIQQSNNPSPPKKKKHCF
jgi:hypothetical protein